jgi:hypothetical protein
MASIGRNPAPGFLEVAEHANALSDGIAALEFDHIVDDIALVDTVESEIQRESRETERVAFTPNFIIVRGLRLRGGRSPHRFGQFIRANLGKYKLICRFTSASSDP